MVSNVVITGYAGMIGSNLTKRLLEDGNKVVGIDNHITSVGIDAPHLWELRKAFKDRFIEIDGDICDDRAVQLAFNYFPLRENVDHVFNLACPASPPKYQQNAILTLDTCTIGTKNVLYNAALRRSRVVHASTSEVYGDPKVHPQKEDYWGNVNPYGPRGMYDNGKRAAEAYCWHFRNVEKQDVRVVRIFNTYGPGMNPHDGRVVTNFIKQALTGADITIQGDGTQTRSFCYIDDMVEALVRMMVRDSLSDFDVGPVNLGNDEEFTVLELANTVLDVVPTSSKIVHVDAAIDDPCMRRPDTTRAKNILDWSARTPLRQGVMNTVPWLASTLEWMNDESL